MPRETGPSDLVFFVYVAATGLLAATLSWRISSDVWLTLTAGHAILLLLTLWFSGRRRRGVSVFGFVRDAYPLLTITFLYWELRYLSQIFTNGYNDAFVIDLEQAVFGAQLAMTFSQRFPMYWLSEVMHFFYGTYWLLLPLAAGALYLRRRIEGFRELVFVSLVLFLACYVVYIFFPVAGPFYEFPRIEGPVAEGPFYRFVHWVLADGGSRGAAFPSSHVAVAVGVLLVTWRHDRPVSIALSPLVIGLTVGTVYGRFHYGIDTAAGILIALIGVPAAIGLRRWLRGRLPELQTGNADRALSV